MDRYMEGSEMSAVESKTKEKKGLRVHRVYTKVGVHPYHELEWDTRTSRISNPDGSVVFELKNLEVPKSWSQLATDILASKYVRKAGVPQSGHETSARQVVTRVARSIRRFGEDQGYFATPEDAETFEMELTYMLITQMGAFNSPVWFNCGLAQEYGIKGNSVSNYTWDEKKKKVIETDDAYTRPQMSACFIQSVGDDLMDIADLVRREMKLFKFGSGTGTNFSNIRGEGEKLSSGGTSSGLMSFLEVYDKAAGAIKSGGTTRRAAKMVILDVDHPEIERFISWKAREEDKAALLIKHGFEGGMDGEAYKTVSGQNSNNSVRVTDEFMQAVERGGEWKTVNRTKGSTFKVYQARDLMDQIAKAAWRCADPGLQFDTTINKWHPCPNTDRIRGSNPCSEYMFLDDSACNLASINLEKFVTADGKFDVDKYRHACAIFITAQEIVVDFASYPTDLIAKNSHDYRPLGLGYANLGAVLMQLGIPYDSDEARAWCGAITAITTGHAYRTSAKIASAKGPFEGFHKNKEPFLGVMRMHRDAAYKIDAKACPDYLLRAAQEDWDEAVRLGEQCGYRNAQATVIAPTGTIGLLMDCDTTGIEPDYSLVKFKKLAGGGYFKIVNKSIPQTLRNLGYTPQQVNDVLTYILGTGSLEGVPAINRPSLMEKGLTAEDLAKIEKKLSSIFDLSQVFAPYSFSPETLKRLGIPEKETDLLKALGFTEEQIEVANRVICGWQTIEGAPHVKPEHYPIFDCANRCGPYGKRFLSWASQIQMLAAAQPFISGSISKTINMPGDVTVEDVKQAYTMAWKEGLKCISIYRDGSKSTQPLASGTAKAKTEAETKTAEGGEATVPQRLSHRARLPLQRRGFTFEGKVGGQKVYLRTGEYQDGTLGEIFIDMHKEGAAFRSLINCFAISVSLGLQYGVPLKEYVDTFTFTRFDPQGAVQGHPNIKMATSIIDYIFRVLGFQYLGETDYVQVKPTEPVKKPDEPQAVKAAPAPAPAAEKPAVEKPAAGKDSILSEYLQTIQSDAPFCNVCGNLTVRNGTCYKCLNCGNTMGCS